MLHFQHRSTELSGLMELKDALPFHTLYHMTEELMNEGALLLLTSTGLFRATLLGDVEELVSWSSTIK